MVVTKRRVYSALVNMVSMVASAPGALSRKSLAKDTVSVHDVETAPRERAVIKPTITFL